MSRLSRNGIRPKVMLNALDMIERENIPMHSLLISRHSELIFEAYWKPFERESLHRMYSVTKSFVSLAIGCMEFDGLIKLSDRIIDYYPEYLPETIPPELSAMTIRDMLMMRTCHKETTYKHGKDGKYIPSWRKDWVKSFFDTKPDHDPGTVFIYDTSSSHVLANLVERLTGKDFVSYLREKFLDKLSVSEECYITKDPEGSPCGGSGFMMRSIDLMNVMSALVSGKLDDVIDPEYIKAAVSPLSDASFGRAGDESGYGYFFWTMGNGAYAMYGMGGQYAIFAPKKDLIFVTTADTQSLKGGEALLRTVLKYIEENTLDDVEMEEDEEGEAMLSDRLQALHIPIIHGLPSKIIGTRQYKFNGEGGLENMSFSFDKDGGSVSALFYGRKYGFEFQYNKNVINTFPVLLSSPAVVSAAFMQDGSFVMSIQLLGQELGSIRLKAHFLEGKATILSHVYGEISFQGFEVVATGKAIE